MVQEDSQFLHPRVLVGPNESKGLNKLQKPWTKILLVVNVGSLEKRSNQPKYKESKTRSPKTTVVRHFRLSLLLRHSPSI